MRVNANTVIIQKKPEIKDIRTIYRVDLARELNYVYKRCVISTNLINNFNQRVPSIKSESISQSIKMISQLKIECHQPIDNEMYFLTSLKSIFPKMVWLSIGKKVIKHHNKKIIYYINFIPLIVNKNGECSFDIDSSITNILNIELSDARSEFTNIVKGLLITQQKSIANNQYINRTPQIRVKTKKNNQNIDCL